ncbi:hypothetical protein [Actinoplanes sp. M2I2]|uniref:hypothetical protein n=1 Tax=Actinoplanes sp. M2I2 TaxID=1734444 RepID=UPI002021C71C|nr:hypothetical protein [Actinoplanes sp. M2I2]
MSDLLTSVLDTYGGLDRWRAVTSIAARKRFGGVTWPLKQVSGILDDGDVVVSVQRERTVFHPFTAPGRRATFTPDLVEVTAADGEVIDKLADPRASFAGHTLQTPWTHPQLAYFAGYAMWTYLTEPYSLTLPGVRTEEIGPWREGGATWRRLAVTYPPAIATHSADQVLYVDPDGLIRRRDYTVDVLGGVPGIHYVHDHREVSGIVVPRTRTVYGRGAGGEPQREPVIVSIVLDDVVVA